MKFVLLPSAKDDLNEIRQYLHQESPVAAKKVAARIKSSLLLLTEQPHLGHKPMMMRLWSGIFPVYPIRCLI